MDNSAGAATVIYLDQNQSLLGSRVHYCAGYKDGYSASWPNLAFFCSSCGELWARAIYSFEFDYNPFNRLNWAVIMRRCVKCGDGTLLDDYLDGADSALITREFLALLERY